MDLRPTLKNIKLFATEQENALNTTGFGKNPEQENCTPAQNAILSGDETYQNRG